MIQIKIDGTDISKSVESFEIDLPGQGSFCNSFSASLKGKDHWSLCNPDANRNACRVEISISGDIFKFFLEDRGETLGYGDFSFSISGRSRHAALGEGFASLITDTESTIEKCSDGCVSKCYNQTDCEAIGGTWTGTECTDPGGTIECSGFHVWQNRKTTPDDICGFLEQSDYIPILVGLDWNALNFPIYAGSFVAAQKFPAQVVAELAEIIGAELFANPETENLEINEYSISGAAAASFSDIDEITEFSCEYLPSPGVDNVLILGLLDEPPDPEDEAAGISPYIGIDYDGATEIAPDEEIEITVPYWHPTGATIDIYESSDAISSGIVTGYNANKTELVRLTWGRGNTQYPDNTGKTEIFDSSKADEYLAIISHTYTRKYGIMTLSASEIGEYMVAVYFHDKTAVAEFSFSVIDPAERYKDKAFIEILENSSPPYEINEQADVRVYNYHPAGNGLLFDAVDATIAVTPNGSGDEVITETVTLQWGYGNTSKPDLAGNTEVHFPAHDDDPIAEESVTYSTHYNDYLVKSTDEGQHEVSFYFGDKSANELYTFLVQTEPTSRDITIISENYFDDTLKIQGDAVYIDGAYVGLTDSEGKLTVNNVSIGTHSIKFVKTGYKNSDEDNLENDYFTVS